MSVELRDSQALGAGESPGKDTECGQSLQDQVLLVRIDRGLATAQYQTGTLRLMNLGPLILYVSRFNHTLGAA